MTADELAFLTAICANPADDTARLVYADWLQENGREPLARWVRARVATPDVVTTLGPSDSVSAFGGFVARGLRDLAGKGVYPDGKLHFRRGFVEAVTCTVESWLSHADALAWHPSRTVPCPPTAQPITRVTLTGRATVSLTGFHRNRPTVWECELAGETVRLTETDVVELRDPDPETENRNVVRRVYERRWPGITFALSR